MAEDIPAHVCFHLRSHNVSKISDVKVAENLQQHQSDHNASSTRIARHSICSVKINHLVGDIPDDQWKNQRNGRPQDCKRTYRCRIAVLYGL